MELMIADKIKKYRKEQNMTQDALAQALGVSPQSVSKWECGDGYPDITLLPSIANFFEVTVDELIGNDVISAKEDVQKNYFNTVSSLSKDEQLQLALKYHKKYPRDWHIATSLMHTITRNHRDKLDEYKPLLNEVCERLLKECTDSVMRRNAIRSMCTICDEDEIEAWLKKDTQYWYQDRNEIFEERFRLTGETARYWEWHNAGNVMCTAHLMNRFYDHKDYHGKPADSIEWNEMYLNFLDGVINRNGNDSIPDGWIPAYGISYARLAAACFGIADKENGYAYLKKAMELNERWHRLPEHAPLDLGNPLFFGETKILKNDWHITLPCGKKWFVRGMRYHFMELYEIMTATSGWEWFDSVRDEDRWQEILEHAKTVTTNAY